MVKDELFVSLKEDLLLCRICERMIPSSEMPVHNEECMR